MQTSYTDAEDGVQLFTRVWAPSTPPVAIVQIAHGMAEHSARYARLAEALASAGYVVYAHDHRGHGHTAPSETELGHLADADGWTKTADDLGAIGRRARDEHPGVPLFLLGHSMGSLLSRSYVIGNSGSIDGLVLCGTAGSPGPLGVVGRVVATTEARLRGGRAPSKLMDSLTFGSFNGGFKPVRTPFDWLSRDPAQVDAYIADPFCGRISSAQFFVDLLSGARQVNDDAQVARVRAELPILLISGDRDPVGDDGKGVRAVRDQFVRAGLTDVTLKLYPDARHELFNEINADEVVADVRAWLDAHR